MSDDRRCHRCQGLLVRERYGFSEVRAATRCVNCGWYGEFETVNVRGLPVELQHMVEEVEAERLARKRKPRQPIGKLSDYQF